MMGNNSEVALSFSLASSLPGNDLGGGVPWSPGDKHSEIAPLP